MECEEQAFICTPRIALELRSIPAKLAARVAFIASRESR
jgi:hypothetical protein